jgi:predicted cobalt transporter CbtA
LLKLGALAGLVGGIALAVFLRLVGEGPIGDAVALEEARSASAGGTAHEEMFSRATQQLGGMLGAATYGVAVGAILVVVFALVRHRLSARDDWRRAVTLAGVAFVTLTLVPMLKYPANPPAVGNPDTITERTALYLLMIGWSCVATWAAWRLGRWLRVQERWQAEHRRLPAMLATWAVVVGVGLAVLPGSPDTVDAPATLVWRFRMASLGGEALFWAVTGCVLGWLLLREHSLNAEPPIRGSSVQRMD